MSVKFRPITASDKLTRGFRVIRTDRVGGQILYGDQRNGFVVGWDDDKVHAYGFIGSFPPETVFVAPAGYDKNNDPVYPNDYVIVEDDDAVLFAAVRGGKYDWANNISGLVTDQGSFDSNVCQLAQTFITEDHQYDDFNNCEDEPTEDVEKHAEPPEALYGAYVAHVTGTGASVFYVTRSKEVAFAVVDEEVSNPELRQVFQLTEVSRG